MQEGNLHHGSEKGIRKESVLKHQGARKCHFQKRENSLQFEGQVKVKAQNQKKKKQERNGIQKSAEAMRVSGHPLLPMDKENKKEEEPRIVLRRRRNGMLKQAAVGAAEQSKSRETDSHQHLQAAQTSAYDGETFHCSRRENFFWYLISFLPFLNTE